MQYTLVKIFSSLLFLISTLIACKTRDVKDIIVTQTCDCLAKQDTKKDPLSVISGCEQEAINNNKALLVSRLKLDTTSQGELINLFVEVSRLLYLNCVVVKQNKGLIDSLQRAYQENKNAIEAVFLNAAKNGIQMEGRFISMKKVSDHAWELYLEVNNSVVIFQTNFLLNETEIGLLKKKGNNIQLTYKNYTNPKTGIVDKIVNSMTPIYGN